MPSSTAPISCSREICFSALSWRRAPTKSRLTMASVRCADVRSPLKKKRGGHPRHGAAVQLPRSIHPDAWTAQTGSGGALCTARRRPDRRAHRRILTQEAIIELSATRSCSGRSSRLRVLVPLGVVPVPPVADMLAALVIDGLDQTIFQTFTSVPLDDYQSYDKALDVYYLSLAYLAMLRNWVSRDGVRRRAVPVLLPAGRCRPLRADPDPGAPAALPEHVRVLLRHRTRPSGPAGIRAGSPGAADRHRGVHLDRHQAARRSGGSTSRSWMRPSSSRRIFGVSADTLLDRGHRRRAVGHRRGGRRSRRARPSRRAG